MRKLLDDRNRRTIEGVSCSLLICPYSSFAENHLICSGSHKILCGHKPFLDSCRKTSLEKNRHAGLAYFLQQLEILHIPCSDLEHIDILCHHLHVRRRNHFRCDRHIESIAGFLKKLETFFTQSLERIRAGPWLECTATKHHSS